MSIFSRVKQLIGRKPAVKPPSNVYSIKLHANVGIQDTLVRLSPDGEFSQAAIDPEGRNVAFWGRARGSADFHLWITDIATKACNRVTQDPGLHGHPAWWPDGKSLVYFSTAGVSNAQKWSPEKQFSPDRPGASLFRLDIASGKRIRLTTGNWVDERPAVSPSGEEVVFVSNRSGRTNLWALSVKNSELRQITKNTELDYRPSFSPDGGRLAYFTKTSDGTHQLALLKWPELDPVEIDTGRLFQWAHGPHWFSTSDTILFHGLKRKAKRPQLWRLNLKTAEVVPIEIPGVEDCSHGSLDAADATLAFDSRKTLPRTQSREPQVRHYQEGERR